MPFRYDIGTSTQRNGNHGEYELGISSSGDIYKISKKSLFFHSIILGRTGTGKSNLLRILCNSYIKEPDSNLIIIDFHGSLSNQIVSLESKKDLIYLGTSEENGGKKIMMNILKGASSSSISLYLIQEIFSKESSLSGGTWGPRLQTIFTSVLREIISINPDATLSNFMETLLDKKMMKSLADHADFNSRKVIENLTSRWQSWMEYSASSINKLYPIVSDPHLRSLVSSPEESINLMEELKKGDKIVVIDVSKTKFSATQGKIISSLIVNKIWTDILKSGGIKDTMIVADEAQNLNSSVLSEILSEGRKFNLYITVASQYLDQYDRYTREALLSNCGSIYAFNVSERDADQVCSVITNRKKRKEAMKSILLGAPHNSTHFNFISKSGIEVESFTPYLMEIPYDINILKNKINESLKKYGDYHREKEKQEKTLSSHEYLSSFMIRFLETRGVPVESEKKLNNLRPDILFFYDDKPVVVEIEVSDIDHFVRVVEKVVNYGEQKTLLLCERDSAKILYSKFMERNQISGALSNLQKSGKKTYFNFRNILILEERAGLLYVIESGRFNRFSLDKVLSYETFRENEAFGSDMTEIILSEMKKHGSHYIDGYSFSRIQDRIGASRTVNINERGIELPDLYCKLISPSS